VADVVLFNSRFNRDSFLDNINSFLHTMPDCQPRGVREQLQDKCHVLYFPVQFDNDVSSLDCQLSSCTVAECADKDVCQLSEESSGIADSLIDADSTACDSVGCTDISNDMNKSTIDTNADSSAFITDSSVDTVSTPCDTVGSADSGNDVNESRSDTIADINADTSSSVSLSASIQPVLHGNCDALHIVWPHRWYVHCYQCISHS